MPVDYESRIRRYYELQAASNAAFNPTTSPAAPVTPAGPTTTEAVQDLQAAVVESNAALASSQDVMLREVRKTNFILQSVTGIGEVPDAN